MGDGVFLINEDVDDGLVDEETFGNFVVDLFLRKYGEALPVVAATRRLTFAGAALPAPAAAILPVTVLDALMLPLLKNGSVGKSGIFSSPVRLRSKQCVVVVVVEGRGTTVCRSPILRRCC